MGIEGFVIDGRTYMYFGPFPALLRIPVLLVTHDFDGQMTVRLDAAGLGGLRGLHHPAALAGARPRCSGRTTPVTTRAGGARRRSSWPASPAAPRSPSTPSLPWVYHEVYLWQTALVVAAAYWLVRLGLDPTGRGVAWLGRAGRCAPCSPAPRAGGACALGAAGPGHLDAPRAGRSPARAGSAPWVLAAGLVPLAVGIAYNMLKFGHPYLFPLQDQVWTDDQPAPPLRARGQRRHDHRAAVLQLVARRRTSTRAASGSSTTSPGSPCPAPQRAGRAAP